MQPKIYSIDEHRIPHNKIDNHAYYVIEKLRTSGFIAFLVGGSVRDLLLGVRPKDFDISTSAKPEEIKQLFRRNCILIGRRFRLAHIRFGNKIIEVSTFRMGDTEESSLILQDNEWGTPEQDVLRRDFTINGLFYDPEVQTVIDYVGGFPDIEKKVLRTIGKSETRFVQDPVRMIRLIKFEARFNLSIDPDTLIGLEKCKNEIIKSSPARILEELLRMLESGASKPFFNLLRKYGLIKALMPLLAEHMEKQDNPIYALLDQADIYNKKNHPEGLERSVLVSCLVFPILKEILFKNYVEKNKKLHLGLIAEETKILIDDLFRPFLHMPRKMKSAMISLITNQFRLMPIESKRRRSIRLPRDPFFNQALKFFNLRCMIEPELFQTYNIWNEAYLNIKKHNKRFFRKNTFYEEQNIKS